jgi:bacterioferritin-associated ferredoxin
MIICLCHRVSDRDIAREAAAGCTSFDALQEHTRVATACGVCLDDALQVFDSQRCGAACGGCPGRQRASMASAA